MERKSTATSDPDPFAFLVSGGEMGDRTRAFDWSKSPVGPVEAWPQCLKTAVSICLGSSYPIVIWWGKDALTQLYNDAYISILGVTKHPGWLGRSGRECWSEIWSVMGPMWDSVFATGEAVWSEDFLYVLDRNIPREEGYFTFSYSPIRDDAGAVGGIFCACNETTDRVIGERRLRTLRDLGRMVTTAKTAEEACDIAVRTVAENTADIPFALIYLLDDEARYARLVAATGLEAGSGPAPTRIDLSEPAEQPAWPLRRVFDTATGELVAAATARLGPLPGGPWPESSEAALVLPIAAPGQAQPTGFLVTGLSPRRVLDADYRGFLDLIAGHITTAVANACAYEEEQRRAEALAELDRAKTAFFSNVSHEFRTPLTLMLGPVEDLLARSHTDLTPAATGQLEIVSRNGLRLLRLVNTLLDFSRIEAGRVRAVYQPTDLATFTADLASVFRSTCERAGLRLVVSCPPLAEPVFVDREMWEKIVLNLLSNAFKFTFEGEIAVSLWQAGGSVELQVRDTGTGIPAEEMPRLFERFHRVQQAQGRTHEGSGIGLALVQELVKLHGGSVRAESVVGKGTTFLVTVPLGSAHLPADQIGEGRTAASTGTGASPYVEEALRWLPDEEQYEGRSERLAYPEPLPTPYRQSGPDGVDERPRVLVADDNADMRQYIARLLAEQLQVETVPDGEAALAAVRERPPDLILTDVMMPRLNGFGLLRELRADPRTRDLPVVMLSARAGEESRVEGMEAGADDYLVKPFSARELLARVSAHLQMARLRREATKTLRRSEERFQLFMAHSPATAFIKDEDGRYVYVNRTLERDFNRPLSEWVGKTDYDIFSAEQAAQLRQNDAKMLASRTTAEFVESASQADGLHYYHTFKFPLQDRDGRWLLGGMAIDITDRKRAEETLRASEARAKFLADASAALADLNDPDSTLQKVAGIAVPAFADWCVVDLLDNEGSLQRVAVQHADPHKVRFAKELAQRYPARPDDPNGLHEVIRTGKPRMVEDIPDALLSEVARDAEHLRILRELGLRSYIRVPMVLRGRTLGVLSFIMAETGHAFDAADLALAEDLAHRAAIAIENANLYRTLREDDRRKNEFLATLAHELRNPLAPLRNGLQVMKLARNNVGAVEQARNMMERQLGHMVRLIDDLLDLSRISRDKVELRKERIELAKAVRQAVETSRPLIEASFHDLTIDVPHEPIFVDADLTRLAQVFANLLNNAAKYTERGGRITLTVKRQGNEVVVSVRDTGVGIPAHMLPKLFEMFTQVDRSLERSQGGLGIGLSLVKKLVEMHGGSVEAKSGGHGMGSEFLVRLPVVLSLARPRQDEDEEGEAAATARRRVLVVDDNVDAALSLAMMLELMGNETQTAHDGLEALDVAAVFRPDVILLDIGMPKLNGYDACRRIRQQPWGKTVVLIALTGWGQEEDRRKSEEAGFNFHMVKPPEPAALEKLLAGLRTETG